MLSTSPEALRDDLREGCGPFLKCRRAIAGLSIFSCTVLGGIALFQLGVVKHLPDPPIRGFDADALHGGPEAFARFGVPDALLGLASYSATATLAGMGPKDRWRRARWIPIAMATKALLDAAMAGRLTFEEAVKYRTFSVWSLVVAAATFTALPLALPEALRACGR
jgi:hypothetical protein